MRRNVNLALVILVALLSVTVAIMVVYYENTYFELTEHYRNERNMITDQYNQLVQEYNSAINTINELQKENQELKDVLVEKDKYIQRLKNQLEDAGIEPVER